MFCSNCGTKLDQNAVFCSECGQKVNQDAAPAPQPEVQPVFAQPEAQPVFAQQPQNPFGGDFVNRRAMLRQEEMDSLTNAYNYFMQKKPVYDEYVEVCKKVNYYGRGAKSFLIIFGSIILGLGLFTIMAYLADEMMMDALGVLVILFVVPGALMLAGGILMKVANRKNFKKYLKKYSELSMELYNHYLGYPNCPVEDYFTHPDVIAIIANYIRNGRVTTLKDAIELACFEGKEAGIYKYFEILRKYTASIPDSEKAPDFFSPPSFFK